VVPHHDVAVPHHPAGGLVSAPSERESARFLREHPVLYLFIVVGIAVQGVLAMLAGDRVAGALFLGRLLWWPAR
jgi:hypothetical protein